VTHSLLLAEFVAGDGGCPAIAFFEITSGKQRCTDQ
jgi:hypothetical protein